MECFLALVCLGPVQSMMGKAFMAAVDTQRRWGGGANGVLAHSHQNTHVWARNWEPGVCSLKMDVP